MTSNALASWCTSQCGVCPQYRSSVIYRAETYNSILTGHKHIFQLMIIRSIKYELVKTCSLGRGTTGFSHIGQYD
jgi:hypothetical protein